MCGGIGSRFWPFSRSDMPKQFLDFFGMGRSLLQMTFDRIAELVEPQHVILVTNESYAPLVRSQLPEVPEQNILCEPARRNTAPCVCWAAHHIAALDPKASIITLPSDHIILREKVFCQAVDEGLTFVEHTGGLLTLGIKPTSPHTGYGYIQRGQAVKEYPGIDRVKSFTEKPNAEMAQVLLDSGEFFWNSGIFLWTAQAILKAFAEHDSKIAQLFDLGAELYGTPGETAFIAAHFPNAPSISIDYSIMEKASNVFVKTVDIGWSDLGSWKALYETSPKDRNGNVTQNCKILTENCSGSVFAVKGDKIVVASGLKDYIVAENGNALLIYPIADEQSIRRIVNEVKSRFGEDYV